MKKKITKKLALSKETLRNLQVADLEKAGGGVYVGRGATVESGCTGCDPSVGSCNTCQSCPC
jgi:hypothetical protein